MMLSRIFMVLCYVGLVLAPILSYWHVRWGAMSVLIAIALAHIAGIAKADAQAAQTQESLFVILQQFSALRSQLDQIMEQTRVYPGNSALASGAPEERYGR